MDIPARIIVKILLIITGFVGVLVLAFLARQELAWIGIGLFLAIALNPAVEWLRRWMPRRNRGAAIGAVFVLGLLLLVFLLVSFVPPLLEQSQLLSRNLPRYTDQLVHGHSWVSEQIRAYNLVDRVRESQDQAVSYLSSAGTQFIDILRRIFSSFVAGLTILGLTFFMLLEGPGWVEAFWTVVPRARRTHAQELAAQMYRAVTGYVNGNLLTSLAAALTTAIALAIAHVPYAIPLGIFVGIMDLLPLVGATIGAIVVLLVALFTSLPAAIGMAIFFAIYQQFENHVLQPVVYGRTVEISPLLVLVAVLVGAAIGGILGAIVAIPIFASLRILVKDYAERHLARNR